MLPSVAQVFLIYFIICLFFPCRCKVGKHTTEKPVPAKPAAAPKPSPVAVPATNSSSKDACPRCRQGFFCSEHGILLIHIFFIIGKF